MASQDEQDIRDVVARFAAASKNANRNEVAALICPEDAKAYLDNTYDPGDEGELADPVTDVDIRWVAVRIDGDDAAATSESPCTPGEITVHLQRFDAGWLMCEAAEDAMGGTTPAAPTDQPSGRTRPAAPIPGVIAAIDTPRSAHLPMGDVVVGPAAWCAAGPPAARCGRAFRSSPAPRAREGHTMSTQVRTALLVRLEALPGKEDDVRAFLEQGLSIVEGEPKTVRWFGIRFGPSSFGVFDAFPDEDGRQAHLSGGVGTAIGENVGVLFEQPTIEDVDVIAEKQPT